MASRAVAALLTAAVVATTAAVGWSELAPEAEDRAPTPAAVGDGQDQSSPDPIPLRPRGVPLDGQDGLGPAIAGAGKIPAAAARRVVSAWARPQLERDAWWGALSPMLSASAQQAYGYTEPSTVPALEVLSSQRVSSSPDAPPTSRTYALVNVTTTAGAVVVTLTRPNTRSGWLMDRMDLSEVIPTAPGVPPGDGGETGPEEQLGDLGDGVLAAARTSDVPVATSAATTPQQRQGLR